MPLLDTPGVIDHLQQRLAALTPETPRQWGTLTAHEMMCHLSDSFRSILRERAASPAPSSALQRQLTRFVALHTPLPWPKGIQTRPEVDPRRLGTRPVAFEADREELGRLMRRFVAPETTYGAHPMFGTLSRREWMLWGHRHVDHHFRQFGI